MHHPHTHNPLFPQYNLTSVTARTLISAPSSAPSSGVGILTKEIKETKETKKTKVTKVTVRVTTLPSTLVGYLSM